MKEPVKIVLRSGKDQSPKRYHPWIFSGAIMKIHGEPGEGEIVKVYSNQEEFLGTGHYQDGSIAIRILSFREEEIGEDFYILGLSFQGPAAAIFANTAPGQFAELDLEGRTLKLSGSAETQYQDWRRMLHEIYLSETGFSEPQDPDDAPRPAGASSP